MPNKKTEIIKAGEPFYGGRFASVPQFAKKDILLPREWGMFEDSPNHEPLSSMATAFLAQPERTGGVTGFLSD